MSETGQSARDTIFDTVAEFFSVSKDTLSDATTAQDVPGWDSPSHIPLMLEIEDRLGFEFPLERLGSVDTLGDLIKMADELQQEGGAAA